MESISSVISTLKRTMVQYCNSSTLKWLVRCVRYDTTRLSVPFKCVSLLELILNVFTDPAMSSSQEATSYFLSLSFKLDSIPELEVNLKITMTRINTNAPKTKNHG